MHQTVTCAGLEAGCAAGKVEYTTEFCDSGMDMTNLGIQSIQLLQDIALSLDKRLGARGAHVDQTVHASVFGATW